MEVLKKKDPLIFLTKLLKLTILKPWRNAGIRYGLIVKIYTFFGHCRNTTIGYYSLIVKI
jgi:hypothetical protein